MKKTIHFLFLITMSSWCNHLFAEQAPLEIQWRGDLSSSLQYLVHSRSYAGEIGTGIQDAILHTELKSSTRGPLKATLGFGVLEQFNYESVLVPFSPIDAGVHYGWIEYQTSSNWLWQLGQLKGRAGLEQGVSTRNAHILFGAINHSRSFYYPAARVVFTKGSLQAYAELAGPEVPNAASNALGAQLDYGSGMLAFNLTNYGEESIAYNANWSQEISMLSIGGVLDYTVLNDNPAWQDDEALAIAAYLGLQLEKRYLALRGEYFDAGNTGIYGYENAGVITLTVGHSFTSNSFVRVEGFYAKSSNNVFVDNRVPIDNQYGFAIQLGMRFGKIN